MLSYSLVAPLVDLASEEIPSQVTVVVPNVILVAVALVVVAASDVSLSTYVTHPDVRYLVAAGLFLSVGIIAYYRALGTGDVSVVVPVFGLFLVGSSLLGIVFLDEPLTWKKGLGIVFAALAVVLTSMD